MTPRRRSCSTSCRSSSRPGAGDAARRDHRVSNLLDFSRIEGGALRARARQQDLAELVGAVVARLGPRLAGRPISLDVPDDLPSVACDYGQIEQVVSNLIENAAL